MSLDLNGQRKTALLDEINRSLQALTNLSRMLNETSINAFADVITAQYGKTSYRALLAHTQLSQMLYKLEILKFLISHIKI